MKKIKKSFISFWVLLSLSVTAMSQYSSVMTSDVGFTGSGTTIVRNMSSTEVVTYVWDNTTQRFTYENNSTLNYKIIELTNPPFDKVIVKDFRIINDVLYFCGKDIISNEGVLGTFKATDFYNPIPATTQVDFFDVSGTTELNKMDVYKDPATGNPRIAAVGYNRGGTCGLFACGVWVDCEGFMPGSAPTSVSIFDSYYSAPRDNEQWYDVVSTDEWVVLVGYGSASGQQGLALRRFHKGNPTDPEINNIYIYNEYDRVTWEGTCAEYLKENNIAVAYYGEKNIGVSDFTRFRIFDIGNMANINSQEYVIPDKSALFEMAYMQYADRLVVLNYFPTPSFLSNFVYLIPYQSTTYTSVYVNDNDWQFQSLTNLDGKYFVGTGTFHFLLRDAAASYPANNNYSSPTAPTLCPADEMIKVDIIGDIVPFPFFAILPSSSPTPSMRRDTPPVLGPNMLSVRCFSY